MTVEGYNQINASDDKLLRDCLKNNPMAGSICLTFENEPSFNQAINVLGHENLIAFERNSKNHIKGFAVRSIRKVHINEKPTDIGYLSNLRINRQYRNSRCLYNLFEYLRIADSQKTFPFYITTIAEKNQEARKHLESGRANLPNYVPFDRLSTFVLKPGGRNKTSPHRGFEVLMGDQFSAEEIVSFLNAEGSKKQFFPYISPRDFDNGMLNRLKRRNFYIAVKNSQILGTIAKWDQTTFKQTRVTGYDLKTKLSRPLINVASKFSAIPFLPPPGQLLNYFYTAFPVVRDNDPEVFLSLLTALKSDPKNQSFNYFTLGLTLNDPLIKCMKKFRSIVYNTIIYVVSFKKPAGRFDFLNGRPSYLEIGTL